MSARDAKRRRTRSVSDEKTATTNNSDDFVNLCDKHIDVYNVGIQCHGTPDVCIPKTGADVTKLRLVRGTIDEPEDTGDAPVSYNGVKLQLAYPPECICRDYGDFIVQWSQDGKSFVNLSANRGAMRRFGDLFRGKTLIVTTWVAIALCRNPDFRRLVDVTVLSPSTASNALVHGVCTVGHMAVSRFHVHKRASV